MDKNSTIMKKKQHEEPQTGRRFCKAVDGPMIEKWYARMQTSKLARLMRLTVKQIENYVYRHNTEPWARKLPSVRSAMNSEKGKKGGGRPRKVEK